jgi:hypothetical protein
MVGEAIPRLNSFYGPANARPKLLIKNYNKIIK